MFSQKLNTLIILCGLMLLFSNASAQSDSDQEKNIDKKPTEHSEKDFLINIRPLQDLADRLSKDDLDLTKPFLVEIEGVLQSNGRFDIRKTRYTKAEGDKDIVDVAKLAIESFGDSGVFQFLTNLEIQKMKLTMSQNEKDFAIDITSNLDSKERALTIASGFRNLFTLALLTSKNENERFIANNFSAGTNDSQLQIKFNSPKLPFNKIINHYLKRASKTK